MNSMDLYHFTHYYHFREIQATGEIRTTESNIAENRDWELALHGSVEAMDTYYRVDAVAREQYFQCFVCDESLDDGRHLTLFTQPGSPAAEWVLCEDCTGEAGDGSTGGHEALILLDLGRRMEQS